MPRVEKGRGLGVEIAPCDECARNFPNSVAASLLNCGAVYQIRISIKKNKNN